MVRVSRRLAVIVALLGLLPISPHGDAASPRRWYVAISGPTRVAADRDYSYTVVVTNDGGVWTTSAKARSFFRLAFDLTERYGEGTVGVSDILVHPTGPPAADGALPCAVHRGCSFTRVGSRVDFLFTKEDVTIPPMAFDVVVHTASVFRVGDAIAVSAGLQSGWMPPLSVFDGSPTPYTVEGTPGATILAEYPQTCDGGGDAPRPPGGGDSCPRPIEIG